MLCYVMLRYVMLCYVMLCCVILCYVMLYYAMKNVLCVKTWYEIQYNWDLLIIWSSLRCIIFYNLACHKLHTFWLNNHAMLHRCTSSSVRLWLRRRRFSKEHLTASSTLSSSHTMYNPNKPVSYKIIKIIKIIMDHNYWRQPILWVK